jgi:hypothetical protein
MDTATARRNDPVQCFVAPMHPHRPATLIWMDFSNENT